MSDRRIQFIWGPGGVGKSHWALHRACHCSGKTLLITLDPSPRVFKLVGKEKVKGEVEAKIGQYEFTLKASDADLLFQELNEVAPANERVKWYFQEMVAGLQRFRDYLSLIQLASDLEDDRFEHIIVDTPPFHEAMGLHQSIFTLGEFFERSLVKFAVKSSFVNVGLKKMVEVVRLFIGKESVETVMQFLDWLNNHIDRFQTASKRLEKLTFDDDTAHHAVITPETSYEYIFEMKKFFEQTRPPEFIINRSVEPYDIPAGDNSFFKELRSIKAQEDELLKILTQTFDEFELKRLPMLLMGQDTTEELQSFVATPAR